MSQDELMAEIDQRANLAFSNEMEMLTFFLTDNQLYGINVFKIVEILECPEKITSIPHSHAAMVGTMDFRGKSVPLIDLSYAMGLTGTNLEELSYVLICEYSTTVQGFLITQPNMLLHKRWDEIHSPKGNAYESGYLTAITYHKDDPIQILDVEKLLSEIIGIDDQVSETLIERSRELISKQHHILAVDDSKAARSMISSALTQLEIKHTIMEFASDAYTMLEQQVEKHGESPYSLILSDIEMPTMDGFTFTRKVKNHPKMKDTYLVLHSSLSNRSNRYKAEQMGADEFIPKFQPDLIAEVLLELLTRASIQKQRGIDQQRGLPPR
ncbi:MAG: chemotaxis protein CheV [Magnetococcales bacterium]|nr:chemotaxis protein CheV [Magnetococcales bacterium]